MSLRPRRSTLLEAASLAAAGQPPDLVVLDLGQHDLDSADVVGLLRRWTQAPVIVLSGRAGRATGNLRLHMTQLRRKLEPDPARPRWLAAEPGMGYRFQPGRSARS